MNNRDFKLLERCFDGEIRGGWPIQSNNKRYGELEKMGLVAIGSRGGRDRFGEWKVTGWVLTILGNMKYCEECSRRVAIENADLDADAEAHL